MTNISTFAARDFAALGISGPLLKAVTNAGYAVPTPIQAGAIPAQLAGRDVLGVAQTGSGKTAAFALPILAAIIGLGTKRLPKTARALVLAPTRELAVQIEATIRELARGLHVSPRRWCWAASRGYSQVKRMMPGRRHSDRHPGPARSIWCANVTSSSAETRWLVLDEADRMLDMGFISDVRPLARATIAPGRRRCSLRPCRARSRSWPRGLLTDPVRIEVAPQGTTAAEIVQGVVMARDQAEAAGARCAAGGSGDDVRHRLFAHQARRRPRQPRSRARRLRRRRHPRQQVAERAPEGAQRASATARSRILVATDIAARGIDVPGISHVVNFDLPDEAESYVHRIGRTGRNGADGVAITLCDPSEKRQAARRSSA